MTIEQPGKSSGLYGEIESFPVQKPTDRVLDPAIEKSISLSELITLLESIKGRDFPRTVFIGVFSYSTDEKHFPQKTVVEDNLKKLREVINNESGIFPYGDPYYDVVGVSYWDPKAFDESIAEGERIYVGESPYRTLYPAPALVEGAFNRGYSTSHDRSTLIRFFLERDYAERVIVLPRIRYRGGTLEPEMIFMMQELLPEKNDLLDEQGGILPGDSIFDLPNIPDNKLLEVGIPVFRLEDGEVVSKS